MSSAGGPQVGRTEQSIGLSQWYARFDPSGDAAQAAVDGARRVGPFTLFRPESGCRIATLGDPANPAVVLFDGYLFERRALRREFGLAGDADDATIAAAAFARLGLAALDRLDGSYLVAYWDPRAQRLILGHDALGHHPVYYSEAPDGFWFTANVLVMPADGVVDRSPNRVSFALAALLYWPAAGETFFEHVRRVCPGCYLTVDTQRQVAETSYWSPYLSDDDPGLSEAQAWEQFEPTLVGAIERCMELEPDGIMLSGGLDSVTIAALAAEYSGRHQTPLICAVSGRRDYPPADEEPMQTATAAALGMRHIVARESEWMRGRMSGALSLDAVKDLPGPSRIAWVGGYMAFYRFMAAEGVHVALTGSGGDNWASVQDSFAAHAMRQFRIGDVVRHMRSWTGTGGLSFKAAAHHLLWSGGLRLLLDSYSARFVPSLKQRYHEFRARSAQPAWLCPDPALKQALAAALYRQRPAALTPDGRIPSNFYRHHPRSLGNPYYLYEYEVAFHVESTCGLRLLSPYHDKRVVRFLNSIPPESLLRGDSYKGMLRPLADKRLPGLGFGTQRKAQRVEVVTAEQQELRDAVIEAWPRHDLRRLADLGVVDAPAVKRDLDPVTSTSTRELATMQALMSADRWSTIHVGL